MTVASSTGRMAGTDRRAHLLSVARRVFADGGYRATTMASIADAAAVSEPLLFKYFGSKEDLYRRSIIEPLVELLRDRTDQRPADWPVEDQQLALRDFLLRWAELVRDERPVALTLLADLGGFPDVATELVEMLLGHVGEVADHIAAVTDRPEYCSFDPVVATWSALATVTVAGLVADDIERFVDEYLVILRRGVLA